MTREEIEFIKETLVTAINWASYADDYSKEKYNLKQDIEDVRKCKEMIDNFESRKCENCKYHVNCSIQYHAVIDFAKDPNNFSCEAWKQK